MTDFEDYTTTSKNYDEARRPIGVEVILGSIAKVVGGELKKAHLVDIGIIHSSFILPIVVPQLIVRLSSTFRVKAKIHVRTKRLTL